MSVSSLLTSIHAPLSHNTLFTENSVRAMRGAMLDLDFKNSVYWLNGKQTYLPFIDAYHTRSSAAYGRLHAGSYVEYPIDEARIISGVGYQCEAAATNLSSNGLNMINGSLNTNATKSSYGSPVAGFPSPVIISSGGLYWHRLNDAFTETIDVGDELVIQLVVKEGSSGRVRIEFRNTTENVGSAFGGGFGSLFPTSTSTGNFSDVVDNDLGDGIHLITALFTCTLAGTGWALGVGPDSDILGETIILAAQDIKFGNTLTSIVDGARSADLMKIEAADHSLNFTEGALFWRGTLAEGGETGYPRMFMMGDNYGNSIFTAKSDATGRISIDTRSDETSSSGIVNDDGILDFTAGITWRSDGTALMKIHNDLTELITNYIPPVADADLFIGRSQSAAEAMNGAVKRLVGFSTSLIDTEFEDVFAEIAS